MHRTVFGTTPKFIDNRFHSFGSPSPIQKMDSVIGFKSQMQSLHNVPNKAIPGLVAITGSPVPLCKFKARRLESLKKQNEVGQRVLKSYINLRKFRNIFVSAANSDSEISTPSVSETIEQFYACINEKKLLELGELISADCCLDDSSFLNTFRGKQKVLSFFRNLTASMGKNVRFRIDHVCEGDNLTASVDWHLEWKENQLPSTRGCTLFQFSQQGERLLVKKVQTIVESPIKPGILVMALLKLLTSIFDKFPRAAQPFLKSPEAILQTLLKLYKLFLAPSLNPVLAWYINLWKFIIKLLVFAITILQCLSRFFIQHPSSGDSRQQHS